MKKETFVILYLDELNKNTYTIDITESPHHERFVVYRSYQAKYPDLKDSLVVVPMRDLELIDEKRKFGLLKEYLEVVKNPLGFLKPKKRR